MATTAVKKNVTYVVILGVSLAAVILLRRKEVQEPIKIDGYTMGTTYQVTYFDEQNRNFSGAVDSLLTLVNRSISTYDTSSEVSRFNRDDQFSFQLPYFRPPLEKGLEIFRESSGAFDLTVMPLVNAWGFGSQKQLEMDRTKVDSLLQLIGSEKIVLTSGQVSKADSRMQLDFGGIGQGYGADVIADYLRAQGVTDMLIEIGGEGLAIGKNRKTNKAWTVGILDPRSTQENQFFKAYITLSDRSFTTSGNYFNYREIDGKKYSHTIDPTTGYPADQAILSASVFASDAMTADAWATAFMVMGHEKAIAWIRQQTQMDAIIMYSTPSSHIELFISDGIKSNVTLEHDSL